MKVFICLDEKNGMMFNKRRQSKDSIVIKKVRKIVDKEVLYVSEYTQSLFPEGKVCEDFSVINGYAFIENPNDIFPDMIDTLYIFKWNRHYPSDKKFTMDLLGYIKSDEVEFGGSSHEKITLETYKRKDDYCEN
jgi:hypothetical protein